MFKKYTGNEQFDLQINRVTRDFGENVKVQNDLKQIIPQIKDIESWNRVWAEYAFLREKTGDFSIASSYFGAAAFYLLQDDPNKRTMYSHFRENFYKGYAGFRYERYEIPYENSFLPAVQLFNPGAQKTLVAFGGYDSYMEEIILMMEYLKGADYNIIIFDGPGQGTALMNGLKFIMNWERPVTAVLDYFHLNHVSLMGMSWGGYFVMRAAAFEKRIDRIIAMDIFYCALDALTLPMSGPEAMAMMWLIRNHKRNIVNSLINKRMGADLDLSWKVHRGYELTGASTPYDLANEFSRYTMKGLGPLINQEVLLLAGEKDQYVPLKRLPQIQRELCNAASVRSKVFTEREGGAEHCQIGHLDLAFAEIRRFLERPAGTGPTGAGQAGK